MPPEAEALQGEKEDSGGKTVESKTFTIVRYPQIVMTITTDLLRMSYFRLALGGLVRGAAGLPGWWALGLARSRRLLTPRKDRNQLIK